MASGSWPHQTVIALASSRRHGDDVVGVGDHRDIGHRQPRAGIQEIGVPLQAERSGIGRPGHLDLIGQPGDMQPRRLWCEGRIHVVGHKNHAIIAARCWRLVIVDNDAVESLGGVELECFRRPGAGLGVGGGGAHLGAVLKRRHPDGGRRVAGEFLRGVKYGKASQHPGKSDVQISSIDAGGNQRVAGETDWRHQDGILRLLNIIPAQAAGGELGGEAGNGQIERQAGTRRGVFKIIQDGLCRRTGGEQDGEDNQGLCFHNCDQFLRSSQIGAPGKDALLFFCSRRREGGSNLFPILPNTARGAESFPSCQPEWPGHRPAITGRRSAVPTFATGKPDANRAMATPATSQIPTE